MSTASARNYLFSTTLTNSVLMHRAHRPHTIISYTPFGYSERDKILQKTPAFNGIWVERSGHYILGNGFRSFSPVTMRFNSPDNLSPFGKGGLNAYIYCWGDPINLQDPTGHIPGGKLLKRLRRLFSRKKPTAASAAPISPQPPYLNNYLKEFLASDKKEFKKFKKSFPSESFIIKISKNSDISKLKIGNYNKFIFTSKDEMLVAPWIPHRKQWHVSHPAIAATAKGKGKDIISAGYIIKVDQGEILINNHSGHYMPDFESLTPALNYLQRLNLDVRAVRHF